jgi:hypothetical protein
MPNWSIDEQRITTEAGLQRSVNADGVQILQPRVGATQERLPWEMKVRTHQPHRGCITLAGCEYNPVGVAILFGGRVPKVGGEAANLGLNNQNAVGVPAASLAEFFFSLIPPATGALRRQVRS